MSGTCSASLTARRSRASRAWGGGAVEELAALVALGGRDGPVGEAAREQLDIGAGRGQRAAERVVVGRRVGRGIDDVDAHGNGQ